MLQIVNPFKAGSEFQKLKSKRKWILAIMIVVIPTVLSTAGDYLIQQENQGFIQLLQEQQGSQSTGQVQRRGPDGNPMGMIMPFGPSQVEVNTSSSSSIGSGLVLGIAAALIYWFLKSVVFHIESKVLGGEEASLSSTIHMVAFTGIPLVFKGILDILKGITYQTPSSTGTFMPQVGTDSLFLDFIDSHFTIFVVWALVLMIIAVKEQYLLSKKKAFCVVMVPYIIAWVLQWTLLSSGGLTGMI